MGQTQERRQLVTGGVGSREPGWSIKPRKNNRNRKSNQAEPLPVGAHRRRCPFDLSMASSRFALNSSNPCVVATTGSWSREPGASRSRRRSCSIQIVLSEVRDGLGPGCTLRIASGRGNFNQLEWSELRADGQMARPPEAELVMSRNRQWRAGVRRLHKQASGVISCTVLTPLEMFSHSDGDGL